MNELAFIRNACFTRVKCPNGIETADDIKWKDESGGLEKVEIEIKKGEEKRQR